MSFGSAPILPWGNLVWPLATRAWHPSAALPPRGHASSVHSGSAPRLPRRTKKRLWFQKHFSPRAPGSLQTQAACPVPSPDTAVTQKKQGHFWLPCPEHRCLEAFCLCPHLPGQSF